ncbi:tRNA (cytosine(72)-C(5))-methyltransferase NSUN6-like [Glandiceps talaboti]
MPRSVRNCCRLFVSSNMDHTLPPIKLKPEVENYLKEAYCNKQVTEIYGKDRSESRFVNLLSRLSTPPCNTVVRVNLLYKTRQDVQKDLQHILNEQYKEKQRPCPMVETHPVLADTLVIASSGINTDIVPSSKEVIVDAACGNAVLRGADVFVPGIMAANPGMQVGDEVSVYSDQDGKCRKGMITSYEGSRVFLGNGIAQVSRANVFVQNGMESGVGIKLTQSLYDAPSLNSILPESIFLQNLPSIVVGHVLNPQPGETVLDMCAAPGGKTTHLAGLMNDQGVVIAVDKVASKVSKVITNATQRKLNCIKAYKYDSTQLYSKEVPRLNQDELEKPPYAAESFDKILLDGPCSALGQRPQFTSRLSLREAKSYPPLQKKLFSNAVALLKTTGTLVYSTCTITLAENEQLVEWALETFPELRLDKQSPHLGGEGMSGTALHKDDLKLLQRFDPASISHHYNSDTIGFFIAKFVKVDL